MHLLNHFQPTQNQLAVLAITAANKEHPAQAASKLNANANLVSARKLLMDLHLLSYSGNAAALTELGMKLAKDNDIIDDAGELTDVGNKLLPTDTNQPESEPEMDMGANDFGNPGNETPPAPPAGGQDMGIVPDFASFSPLFKNILKG